MHFQHFKQQLLKQTYLKLQKLELFLQLILKIFKQLYFNKFNRKAKYKQLKNKTQKKIVIIKNKL